MSRGPDAPQRKPIFVVHPSPNCPHKCHCRCRDTDMRARNGMGTGCCRPARPDTRARAFAIARTGATRWADCTAVRSRPPPRQSTNIPAARSAGCHNCQSTRAWPECAAGCSAVTATQRAAHHRCAQSTIGKCGPSRADQSRKRQPAARPGNLTRCGRHQHHSPQWRAITNRAGERAGQWLVVLHPVRSGCDIAPGRDFLVVAPPQPRRA